MRLSVVLCLIPLLSSSAREFSQDQLSSPIPFPAEIQLPSITSFDENWGNTLPPLMLPSLTPQYLNSSPQELLPPLSMFLNESPSEAQHGRQPYSSHTPTTGDSIPLREIIEGEPVEIIDISKNTIDLTSLLPKDTVDLTSSPPSTVNYPVCFPLSDPSASITLQSMVDCLSDTNSSHHQPLKAISKRPTKQNKGRRTYTANKAPPLTDPGRPVHLAHLNIPPVKDSLRTCVLAALNYYNEHEVSFDFIKILHGLIFADPNVAQDYYNLPDTNPEKIFLTRVYTEVLGQPYQKSLGRPKQRRSRK